MFLDVIKKENPQLLNVAEKLHKEAKILPDSYVIDLDMLEKNAETMLTLAKRENIKLFFMLKQLGRNPIIAKRLLEIGFEAAVVVDYKEALIMMENNIPLGNVGHLVQIPDALMEKIMLYGTQYMTVYSLEKLYTINKLAKKNGIKQKVLLKVVDEDDQLYEGQYGGFQLNKFAETCEKFKTLDFIEIAGLTSFPCFLFDEDSDDLLPTQNVKTIEKAKSVLYSFGFEIEELNIPSATCSRTVPFIRSIGGTQGEPGHALTGTTPLHALGNQPEKPAMVYVSEISHNFKGNGYFYGGGYYRRGHLHNVEIRNNISKQADEVLPFGNDSIDYYLSTKREHEVGATVLAAFRTQIFVTRSDVVLVEGIHHNEPNIVGIFDSLGRRVNQ